MMIGEVINDILEAEAQAERILSDAEVVARKIDKKTQTDIENLRVDQAKALVERVKLINEEQNTEDSPETADMKVDKAKIENARKYIIANLLGGDK